MTEKTNGILAKLALPFHPSRITWKPGALTKDKKKCLAMAYADLRAYQNRLDEVCGLDWVVSYTPWGDRIICHVTISGVTRSSTGEADSDSDRSIAGTSAEAQAFKRACAMFGLGRYLYSLPSVWVEYDATTQRIADAGRTRLTQTITQHYTRAMSDQKPAEDVKFEVGEESPSGSDEWEAIPNATESDKQLVTLFDEAGRELYGDKWPETRKHNIERITGGKPGKLTAQNIQTLINGMNELKKKRQAVTA